MTDGNKSVTPVSGYAAWAQRRLGFEAASTQVIEAPGEGVQSMFESARERKVARFVLGFLPDEFSWPTARVDDLATFVIERFEFVPFVFADEGVKPANPSAVVCPFDSDGGIARLPHAVALARVYAHVFGFPIKLVDIENEGPTAVAKAMADAVLVVNAVRDWSWGFAIDELASRWGRRLVRFHNPGYSPLRHALLNQPLCLDEPRDLPRLREVLAEHGLEPTAARETFAADWLVARDAATRWRRLFSIAACEEFWSGMNWRPPGLAGMRWRGRWLDGAFGWVALHQALHEAEFPSLAARNAGTTIARWIVTDQRVRRGGRLRDVAIGRLARLNPTWIEQYCEAAGGGRGSRAVLMRWLEAAAEWKSSQVSLSPLVSVIAESETSHAEPADPLDLIRAWRTGWEAVAAHRRVSTIAVPFVRAICAQAGWNLIQLGRNGRSGAVSVSPAVDELLESASTWSTQLGAAGPLLRVAAAMRLRRWRLACWACRGLEDACGIPPSRGWSSVMRIGFSGVGDVGAWFGRAAELPQDELPRLLAALVQIWVREQIAEMWAPAISPRLKREISSACAILTGCLEKARSVELLHLLARLQALSGLGSDAIVTVTRYARVAESANGELPAAMSLALWQHGCREDARRVLDAGDSEGDERPCAVFLRACAAALVHDAPLAEAAFGRLLGIDSRFLYDASAQDSRWALAAVLCMRSGDLERSAGFQRRAEATGATGRHLLQLADNPSLQKPALSEAWQNLLAG